MKITHYLYNTFIIETGDKNIAIDPGGLFFYFFRFTTVIPKPEWGSITHILVTHGDPDHYWHIDRVAKVSNAPVVCNKTMVRNIGGKTLMLGPRDKGLAFTMPIKKLHTTAFDLEKLKQAETILTILDVLSPMLKLYNDTFFSIANRWYPKASYNVIPNNIWFRLLYRQ